MDKPTEQDFLPWSVAVFCDSLVPHHFLTTHQSNEDFTNSLNALHSEELASKYVHLMTRNSQNWLKLFNFYYLTLLLVPHLS